MQYHDRRVPRDHADALTDRMTMKPIALLVPFLLASPLPGIASSAPSVTATADDGVLGALQRQLFPTLTPVMATPAGRALLTERAGRDARCKGDSACRIEAARWTDADVERLAAQGDGAAIRRELAGLNKVIAVYAQGVAPAYPLIDGPGVTGTALATLVTNALASADVLRAEPGSAHDPGVALALTLLDSADRLEAVRFGPLAGQENAAAFRHARTVAWQRYKYSAIIVPGIGHEDLNTPLSAAGKLNVHMAAAHYHAGLAPFIILSGSAVHPRGTRFFEAIEMRRALIERYGVPAEALVVDPYARHTTTNVRNAARLLAAMRAPAKPALVVTNVGQASYIAGPVFAERNQRELGYQPAEIKAQLSPNDVEILPRRTGLFIDPADPLDP